MFEILPPSGGFFHAEKSIIQHFELNNLPQNRTECTFCLYPVQHGTHSNIKLFEKKGGVINEKELYIFSFIFVVGVNHDALSDLRIIGQCG